MAAMLAQARSASSSKVPGANFPAASSAGIPLMNKMPSASLARLNGKPDGSPGPELTRLIVKVSLAEASLCASGDRRRHPCRRLVKDVTAGGEVEARITAADGTEPQAGLECDAAALEEQ